MRRTAREAMLTGVFAVALLLAACGGGDDGGSGATGGATGATGTTGGSGGAAIAMQGFAFDPPTLQVPGETTLTVTNNDGVTHTFTLDDGSVDEEVPAGESIDVTVNLTASTGFHCKIHPSMTGTLEVA